MSIQNDITVNASASVSSNASMSCFCMSSTSLALLAAVSRAAILLYASVANLCSSGSNPASSAGVGAASGKTGLFTAPDTSPHRPCDRK